jgi:hypothetical protein
VTDFFFNRWCLKIRSDKHIRNAPRCVYTHPQTLDWKRSRIFVNMILRFVVVVHKCVSRCKCNCYDSHVLLIYRLCSLVVRFPGNRSRGPDVDSLSYNMLRSNESGTGATTRRKNTEELLELIKGAAPV